MVVTSKSPLANTEKFVVLKSDTLKFNIPSNDFARIFNGQLQSIPQSANCGGHFSAVMPPAFWRKSLQISLYEHEPTFIGFPIGPTFVHLSGRAKPEIVLIIFIVVGTVPVTGLRLVAFTSTVVEPG